MTDQSRNNGKRWPDRRILYGLAALCAALLAADAAYHKHATFAVEEWFGFYAIYGFIASAALVLVAKAVRRLVMRPENYYGEDDD